MTDKIKILFLAANPANVKSQLDLAREFKEIDKKLRGGKERDCFELVSEWAVTPDDLQGVLQRHQPHILHFSGHGSKKQGIVLEDDKRNMFFMNKRALANLVKILKDNLRMVVLNACYSKDQAQQLQEIVDFTIGMNKPIGDEAAIAFASHFYQGLAFGRSVQTAFELGKGQLEILDIPESKTPDLLVRYGVDPTKGIWPNGKHAEENPSGPKKREREYPPSIPSLGDVVFNSENCEIKKQVGVETHYHEPERGRKKRGRKKDRDGHLKERAF